MKTIYFVRHGETEANAAGLVSGAGNDTSLTENGRQQARKAGQNLQDKKIELIICSPLSRTVETAAIIANEIGYDANKIVKNPLFIERICGIYEGNSEEEYFKDLQDNQLHHSVETTEQMYNRLLDALGSLRNYKENKILVVSHGGTSRAVRAINLNFDHSRMYEIEKIGNAEIYEFVL